MKNGMKNGVTKLDNRLKHPEDINVIILAITAVAVLLVLSLTIGNKFFSVNNFSSMAFQVPEFGLMSFGMVLCMLSGGIDLSIVSVANLSSILAGYVLLGISNNGGDVTLAILLAFAVALVVATLCGLLNGLIISKLSIFPILATLSTMIFYDGVAMAVTSGSTVVGFPEKFAEVAIAKVGGVPVVFIIFVVVAIILSLILGRTLFGKNIYLYGENKTVALFSGMRTHSHIVKTYTVSGFLAGIGGLMMMARVNSAKVGYGSSYLLQAILVCVLGGLNPDGGRGRLSGVVLGILVLQMLQSGFTLLGFEPYLKNFIWGVVLIGVMIANYYVEKRRKTVKVPKLENKGTQQAAM
jgi:simple sugar transport system permease protein